MCRAWEDARATLYCLDKETNFRVFDQWTTRVTLKWSSDLDDWKETWFAGKLTPADFGPTTVAIVITENGDVTFYDEIAA